MTGGARCCLRYGNTQVVVSSQSGDNNVHCPTILSVAKGPGNSQIPHSKNMELSSMCTVANSWSEVMANGCDVLRLCPSLMLQVEASSLPPQQEIKSQMIWGLNLHSAACKHGVVSSASPSGCYDAGCLCPHAFAYKAYVTAER